MMERPAPQAAELPLPLHDQPGQESTGPGEAAAVRPRADERQVHAELGDPGDEPPVLDRVLLGREVAAAAPGLVADAPEPDPERLGVTAGGPQLGERGAARWRVAVIHPLIEVAGRQAAQ